MTVKAKKRAARKAKKGPSAVPYLYGVMQDMRAELNERLGVIERDIEKIQFHIGHLRAKTWYLK